MYADLGPGQTIELDKPSPIGSDLLYSHEYVADRMRGRMRRPTTLAERTNLYAYVTNNPTKYVDPSGLEKVCGFYVWLYTGSWCVDDIHYQAAVNAAGNVVACWWDCEVSIHKCAGAYLADAAGAGTVLSFTHLEYTTGVSKPLAGASQLTTLQSRLALELSKRGYQGIAQQLLRRGAQQVSAQTIRSGIKSGAAGVAIVEAAFSIYCGWKCG